MFARPTDEAAKGVAQLLENIRQALVKGTLDELLGTQVHEGAECRLVRESDGALWFEIDPDKIQLLVEFAREQFQRFLVVGADGGAQNERLVEKLLATPPDLEKAIRQIKNRKKFFENTRDSVMSEDHQKRDATVGVGQLDWVLRVLDGDGRTDVGKANAAILANQTSAENNG
jgi:hypothetical protein